MITLEDRPLVYDRHGQAKKHVAQMTDDEIEAVARACVPYMRSIAKCPERGYYGLYEDKRTHNRHTPKNNRFARELEAAEEKKHPTHALQRLDERELGNPKDLDDEVFKMLYGARETLVNASTGRRHNEMRILLRSPETKMGYLPGVEEKQPVNLCMVYSVTDRTIVTMWNSHEKDKHLDVASDMYNDHLNIDKISRINGSRFHRRAQAYASGELKEAYMGYLPHDKKRAKEWRDFGLEHNDKSANPWRKAEFDNPDPIDPRYYEKLAKEREADAGSLENLRRRVDQEILEGAKRDHAQREGSNQNLSYGYG